MPSRADVGIGMLGLAETIGTFGNLCPTVDAIHDKVRDGQPGDLRKDLSSAYVRSGLLSLVIAGGAGLLTGSWWPIGGWAVGIAAATVTYESLIPSEHRLGAGILPRIGGESNVIDAEYRVVN